MKLSMIRNCTTLALGMALSLPIWAQKEVMIGIGTQNTTTNTVTGGVVLKEMKLIEKYLPTTGKYKDINFKLDWQNFTSGPPVTNGMMAKKLHFGMMGDYPLVVNGATGQSLAGNETQLIAIIAYNENGSGNGVVVHKDSPYYELADLKGKLISVPFGSAAHGMVLQSMQTRGWKEDFWSLVSQSPEVGTTNLQEKKIEAHANFVPFADLLPYRGFARKIYDGAETKVPTFHGVVVRKDFASEYPEVVVAYLKALIEANNWVRSNPVLAATRIEQWTGIEKEVAYLYLGPNGIHTLDPTIKPKWLETIKTAHDVLSKMNRVKAFDMSSWVNESYLRQAFEELKLDYEKQKLSYANFEIADTDNHCKTAIKLPKEAGEVWVDGSSVTAHSSPRCTLSAIKKAKKDGKNVKVAYVMDQALGIKVFADKAFYSVNSTNPKDVIITPFLLKKDAEKEAASKGGKLATFDEVLSLPSL